MKRSVIITAQGFQDEEFVYPYYRLLEAGLHVDVATVGDKVVHGKYGVPASPTVPMASLNAHDYDVAVLPGGHEAPDRVRQVEEVLHFVREMVGAGKLVGAICHGPWILISAGVVKGRKATCYRGMKDDLINAGAEYIEAPVVIDGNVITSPHYRNNGEFMRGVLSKLEVWTTHE